MRLTWLTIIVLLATALPAHSAAAIGALEHDLDRIPADVDMAIHVRDASALRRQLDGRPLGDWFADQFAATSVGALWSETAGRLNLAPSALADHLVGSSVTVVTRGQAEDADWAVLLSAPPSRWRSFFDALNATVELPMSGHAIRTVPELGLCVALFGNAAVIGPSRDAPLLKGIVQGNIEHSARLRSSPAFTDMAAANRADVLAFVRYDEEPLVGWSLVAANIDGARVRLTHDGSFDRPPLSRQPTEIVGDFSAVEVLRSSNILVYAEPTDLGPMPLESFINSALKLRTDADRAVHDCRGNVRLVAVGAEEGRLRDAPEDILAPVFSVCVQSDDLPKVLVALDQRMHSMVAGVKGRCTRGGDQVHLPDVEQFLHGAPRQVDLTPVVSYFTHDLPLLNALTLSWSVVEGPHGPWYVISTETAQHDSVVKALQSREASRHLVGRFDSVGAMHGQRLALLLESWAKRSEDLAEPGLHDALQEALNGLSGLARGIDRLQWTMARPTPERLRLEVEFDLAPPATAHR